MKWLIILRGVTGVGKSTTADNLVHRLGADAATSLNMDIIEEDQIGRNIQASLKFQYVIAHIYSGQQNIYDPTRWISRFRGTGFRVLSFLLNIGFDGGRERCLLRDPNRTEEQYKWLWDRFQKPPFSEFTRKANVKEITIDAEQSREAICDQILKAIERCTGETAKPSG